MEKKYTGIVKNNNITNQELIELEKELNLILRKSDNGKDIKISLRKDHNTFIVIDLKEIINAQTEVHRDWNEERL